MNPIHRSTGLAALILLGSAALGQGQQAPQPTAGDLMIDKYLAAEAMRLSEGFLDGAKTLAEWEQKRPELKRQYFDMLGLWPLPDKTPLHATITGTLERKEDAFVVDKLHFQSRPGLYVTGNLYRPKKITGKLPAVLYVCGHSGKGRDGNKTAFQDHGMWFASNGYICLIIDTLQLGEIPGIHHGTYREGRWWWQAAGYTPAGVECWNGIRALDYLVSRPDVDDQRLAVTGISGGGAATFWIAAADDRVKCAVPVSGMSDLESYVKNKVINGHCDCMFLINTYQWEWTTIAALVAPRPLYFCNSDNDPIFPMDGNRRISERLRKIYGMYGKPELFDDYVSKGGHAYRPDLRIAIFKWINKHIKGATGDVKDADFKEFPGKELRAFAEEKDVPKDAINAKVDETFTRRATVNLPPAKEWNAWRKRLITDLRQQSFQSLPDRIPSAKWGELANGFGGTYELFTETGIHTRIARTLKNDTPKSFTFWIVGIDSPEPNLDAFKTGELDGTLEPRGIGQMIWSRKSPPNYVQRAHALLGLTVDRGRMVDIAASLRNLTTEAGRDGITWRVKARGQTGVIAAYAALFEPSISEVIIVDPPVSHRDGPIFLNVLRVLDIPEALGLLAPRRLTLINAKDKAFDRTAEIYRLAGAADKFQRK